MIINRYITRFMSGIANPLSESQLNDLRLASSKLSGHKRRSFQAEMSLKYCCGNPRLTETVFGWSRESVELGLAEKRSGIICIGSQSMLSGRKSWEENSPEAAAALRKIAEAHSQQDPTFDSLIAYTRLTSAAAIKLLQLEGFKPEEIPKPSSMARQFKNEVQRLEVFPGGTHKDILVFTTTIGYPNEIQPSYPFRERSAICTARSRVAT
jgi:hypothetical protein